MCVLDRESSMKAMALTRLGKIEKSSFPLEQVSREVPEPGEGKMLLRVAACGVCHTELDEIEGRTPPPVLPVVPGHQVVGRVVSLGKNCDRFSVGDRVGVAWIFSACGTCGYCRKGLENLCADFLATGRDADGGYGEYMVAREDFAYSIPEMFSDSQAAPLLCGGAIGYRSLRLAGISNGDPLGLMGFGASAHLVLQMAQELYPDSQVVVFARGDKQRQFGLELGADWAGDIDETPPVSLQAVIDTTPAWKPVIKGLAALRPAGRLVINVIRKEEADKKRLFSLDYSAHLWQEKEIKSVANICRQDVSDFLKLAATMKLAPTVEEYHFLDANRALVELKTKKSTGAKVLVIN